MESVGPQVPAARDALIALSVAYQGARDVTQEVLRTAGKSSQRTDKSVWPLPHVSFREQQRNRAKAVAHFLQQAKEVIRKVLKEIDYAVDALVASGADVSPAWIVTEPLNGFLKALPIAEIVQVAVEQDAEFEKAIQSIAEKVVWLNRKALSNKDCNSEVKPTKPNDRSRSGQKRGRKPKTMTREEKRHWELWNSGRFGAFSEVDSELNKPPGTTARLVENVNRRNRRKKADTKRTK
jgi:hypothetical protein